MTIGKMLILHMHLSKVNMYRKYFKPDRKAISPTTLRVWRQCRPLAASQPLSLT